MEDGITGRWYNSNRRESATNQEAFLYIREDSRHLFKQYGLAWSIYRDDDLSTITLGVSFDGVSFVNIGSIFVPVVSWTDTDTYDPATAGTYTFTAVLGDIPEGYANTGDFTANVKVIITE